VSLSHPRRDAWDSHVRWSPTFRRIIGRTPPGRATVAELRLTPPLSETCSGDVGGLDAVAIGGGDAQAGQGEKYDQVTQTDEA
jgi:hypothetical protein